MKTVQTLEEAPIEPIPAGTGASRQILIGPDDAPHFAMRRFIMEPGGGMPMHTNTVEHEQYVLRGRATIVIAGEEHKVEPGNVVYIPANVPHEYRSTGEEPFEFLCMVPNLPDTITLVES